MLIIYIIGHVHKFPRPQLGFSFILVSFVLILFSCLFIKFSLFILLVCLLVKLFFFLFFYRLSINSNILSATIWSKNHTLRKNVTLRFRNLVVSYNLSRKSCIWIRNFIFCFDLTSFVCFFFFFFFFFLLLLLLLL